MADGKLNPDTESWLVIIAAPGLPLINCFSLIFKGEWKQRRKKGSRSLQMLRWLNLSRCSDLKKATLSFHLILNRFLEWNETVINDIALSHWQKVRTNTLIKHLNTTRKYGSKLRTQTRNNLSFLVYLQKTLEPVIVLTQSQSLACFPRGGFVCLSWREKFYYWV